MNPFGCTVRVSVKDSNREAEPDNCTQCDRPCRWRRGVRPNAVHGGCQPSVTEFGPLQERNVDREDPHKFESDEKYGFPPVALSSELTNRKPGRSQKSA